MKQRAKAKRLQRRITAYQKFIEANPHAEKAMKCPGSYKKS